MRYCICCGKDIVGKPVELNPPDPNTALCRPCNTAQKAAPAASQASPSSPCIPNTTGDGNG